MKRKRKLLWLLVCMALVLALAPAAVFGQDAITDININADTGTGTDANGQTDSYYKADEDIIRKVIESSTALKAEYDVNNPADWDFVSWVGDPLKVASINLEKTGVTDLTGTLDVSGLGALVTLICPNNPNLKEIELPTGSNSIFQYLNCIGTGISALDVSAYQNLEVLYCDGTAITFLNLSNNPALRALGCSNTGITSLDISKNIALEELRCNSTGIRELDVSANLNLTSLVYDADAVTLKALKGSLRIKQTQGGTIRVEPYNDKGINNSMRIIAVPDPGYVLSGWNGLPENAVQNGMEATFTITGDMTASAVFSPVPDAELDDSPAAGDDGILSWMILAGAAAMIGSGVGAARRKRIHK